MRSTLLDVEKRAHEYPETFEIPSAEDRRGMKVGDFAKVIFETRSKPKQFERMWIEITYAREGSCYYHGNLASEPVLDHGAMWHGQAHGLEARNVIEIRPGVTN